MFKTQVLLRKQVVDLGVKTDDFLCAIGLNCQYPPAGLPPTKCLPPPSSGTPSSSAIAAPLRHILKSPSNIFGLFRQYHATSFFPTHDPESNIQAVDLSDVALDHDEAVNEPTSFFKPYPNKNAFLLGEWYWNNGSHKTQDSFRKLLDIISSDNFNPADVRNVAWSSLDKVLGESANPEDRWLDEPDAGWKETLITLSIPFRQKNPPPGKKKNGKKIGLTSNIQPYTFPPFRHRSIVSILRGKDGKCT